MKVHECTEYHFIPSWHWLMHLIKYYRHILMAELYSTYATPHYCFLGRCQARPPAVVPVPSHRQVRHPGQRLRQELEGRKRLPRHRQQHQTRWEETISYIFSFDRKHMMRNMGIRLNMSNANVLTNYNKNYADSGKGQ